MSSDTFDLAPLETRAMQLVDEARKAGADAADAIVASSRSGGIDVRDGKVEERENSENDAFSLRVFVGDRSSAVSANRGADATALAQRAVAMAKAAPENPHAGLADSGFLETSIADLDLFDGTFLSNERMEELAIICEAAALDVPGVSKSSGASCSSGFGGTVLATSHGFIGSYRASRYSLSVSVVAGDGTKMERDYDFDSQRHLADLRGAVEIGKGAGARAAKRINPKSMPTQSVPVIFDPRVSRGLVGHLVSSLNGASVARKTSFLREAMGTKICRTDFTIIDQPKLRRGLASRPFDGEGVIVKDLPLIEKGVVMNWLLDSSSASELGLTTNGRANRSGSGTSPGSTNLTVGAGKRSPSEMIKDLPTGLYVTELIGQGVNLITGDYSRGASGYWIENGELTIPVSEITIAGNLADIFANMEPANDLDPRHAINAPTIMVEGLTLAGR